MNPRQLLVGCIVVKDTRHTKAQRLLGALRRKARLFYLRRTYITYIFLFNIIKILYLFPIICLFYVIFWQDLGSFFGVFCSSLLVQGTKEDFPFYKPLRYFFGNLPLLLRISRCPIYFFSMTIFFSSSSSFFLLFFFSFSFSRFGVSKRKKKKIMAEEMQLGEGEEEKVEKEKKKKMDFLGQSVPQAKRALEVPLVRLREGASPWLK